MGLYTDQPGRGAADVLEARVAAVRVRDRETLRAAGLAEVDLSIPSRSYGTATWILGWEPDGDEVLVSFAPRDPGPEVPTDVDGDLDDEILELGQYLVCVVILGDRFGHPVLTWESEGFAALDRIWGLDTADLQGTAR